MLLSILAGQGPAESLRSIALSRRGIDSFNHISVFAEVEEKMCLSGCTVVVFRWHKRFSVISKTLQLAKMGQVSCVLHKLVKVDWAINMESD